MSAIGRNDPCPCGSGNVMTGDPEFGPLADAGLVAVEWLPRQRP